MKTAFRKHLEAYFNFSKAERNAVLFLCVLVLILIITPFLWPLLFRQKVNINDLKSRLAVLQQDTLKGQKHMAYKQYDHKDYSHSEPATARFAFDPNTVSVEAMKRLGFKPWIAERVDKYRHSGAVFYELSDLKKIYGIDTSLLNNLAGLMQFPARKTNPDKFQDHKTYTARTPELVDLNTADTAVLMALPGIGAGFAKRIIKYRDKLGGFYDKSQLKEVYGLEQQTYELVEARIYTGPGLRKININTVTAEALKHPYLTYSQVKTIIAYRQQHGPFKGPEDLLNVRVLSSDVINKLSVYLSF